MPSGAHNLTCDQESQNYRYGTGRWLDFRPEIPSVLYFLQKIQHG